MGLNLLGLVTSITGLFVACACFHHKWRMIRPPPFPCLILLLALLACEDPCGPSSLHRRACHCSDSHHCCRSYRHFSLLPLVSPLFLRRLLSSWSLALWLLSSLLSPLHRCPSHLNRSHYHRFPTAAFTIAAFIFFSVLLLVNVHRHSKSTSWTDAGAGGRRGY